MKHEELREFLQSRMRLNHIYQPLIIRTLIEIGGTATIRQLATVLLSQDESQIAYYQGRLKEWPMRVLTKHGIIERQGDLIRLRVDKLTFTEKAELKKICEEKLQTFGVEKGLAIWDYRLLDESPISDSLRFRVLKESGGRCALCGASKDASPLDVDHIIPRSKHGKTEYANLQVLCAKCNRSKRDQDDTDFRMSPAPDYKAECEFCIAEKTQIILSNDLCIAFIDKYPVTNGHTLIVPRRHVKDFFEMSEAERAATNDLLRIRRRQLMESDTSVTGFNVGVNCGETAGQTIEHCHTHLIPRRPGDTMDPEGGVRAVIPGKGRYR